MTGVRNIILIGFMGAGKSVVGRSLANAMSRPFFDTDTMVEETVGVSIEDMFATVGEEAFREVETRTIQDLADLKGVVIATGGGALKNPENVKILKHESFVIYLYAKPEILFERIKGETGRPIADKMATFDDMRIVLAEREPLYRKIADFTVDTSDKAINVVENEIFKTIGY
jgi:shikimate kinase